MYESKKFNSILSGKIYETLVKIEITMEKQFVSRFDQANTKQPNKKLNIILCAIACHRLLEA